jgi:hypothetical protein
MRLWRQCQRTGNRGVIYVDTSSRQSTALQERVSDRGVTTGGPHDGRLRSCGLLYAVDDCSMLTVLF